MCCAVLALSRAARRDRQDAQDAAAAAQAQMVSEVSAARSHLAAARRQARAEVEKAAAAADGKMREYVDKFREQVGSSRSLVQVPCSWRGGGGLRRPSARCGPASQSVGLCLPARADGSDSTHAVIAVWLRGEGWRVGGTQEVSLSWQRCCLVLTPLAACASRHIPRCQFCCFLTSLHSAQSHLL